ncbi:site-specific DNA-methyltransferase [Desulforegula conservatrix]|uniref:site-specific DNA-methyltransferase n=1 Tax=Desulforegula conservatrix TaxID=153026 RepID=UPI000413154C|nr:site-specific DNA-methyltransferase [Desulforegula conservatrix]
MLATTHKIYFQNSQDQSAVDSETVDLVVTSPPYPMIEMWDDIFSKQDQRIEDALNNKDGNLAFELMHQAMDSMWKETFRVLKDGGFACINIGDATRTINGNFALYPNHARIISSMTSLGFTPLPDIIWRKQTNAPNKFMGSGMLPAGAYVTFEHEYILIFRKGSKRDFSDVADKERRRESAYFWEERNLFFSDVWFDIKGTVQSMKKTEARSRSAAFPFELAYRLIAMYSAKGDTVLDPFMGTGTTMQAAVASARNSIGFEIDENLRDEIFGIKDYAVDFSNKYINDRLERHVGFVEDRLKNGKEIKHINSFYDFPVMTNQEKNLLLNELKDIRLVDEDLLEVSYSEEPGRKFTEDLAVDGSEAKTDPVEKPKKDKKQKNGKDKAGKGQMDLWG